MAGEARTGANRTDVQRLFGPPHGRQGEARNEEAGSGAAQSGLVLI